MWGMKFMIIGIGCDIIEINRVVKAVAKEAFQKRVFTAEEITYCQSRGKQAGKSFAARFAAKEAVLKALGTGLRCGALTEIEIVNDELGKPEVKLSGYHAALAQKLGIACIHISLSHSNDFAMAYVVMEDGK